jgi:PIN domain nuclease of toxin-antitoxin system
MGRERVIVLDTHALIWWLCSPANLSARAKRAINAAGKDNAILVSAISVLEIVTLVRRGRLQFSVPVDAWLADVRMVPELRIVPVTADIAQLAGGFGEDMPGDPADRIIAATAMTVSAPLATADTRLRARTGLDTVW